MRSTLPLYLVLFPPNWVLSDTNPVGPVGVSGHTWGPVDKLTVRSREPKVFERDRLRQSRVGIGESDDVSGRHPPRVGTGLPLESVPRPTVGDTQVEVGGPRWGSVSPSQAPFLGSGLCTRGVRVSPRGHPVPGVPT